MSFYSRTTIGLLVFSSFLVGVCATYGADAESVWRLRAREDVDDIWSGVSTGYDFIKRSDGFYVAYYAADRSMTVAKYSFETNAWERKTLPTKIAWDSHNYVTMTFDSNDCLHVSGNMHAIPLIYFRASQPNDVLSLERVESMTGELEKRVTYPRFMYDRDGRLIFTYRDGSSGNGNQIWNVYDPEKKTWKRLLDTPLFDGQGLMNAYFVGPTLGADGCFHVAWVWRDTPDAATNHDLSYARSRDLVHWEKSTGEPYELPITLASGEIVAPIPAGAGLLNSNVRLAFDQEKRVVLTYTKYDDKGFLQIWNARLEKDGWNLVQATDWDCDWHFSGGGSLPGGLHFGAVSVASADVLAFQWNRILDKKSGVAYLDAKTLRPCEAPKSKASTTVAPEYEPEDAKELSRVEGDATRLSARSASFDVNGERWVFRWEAPDANRDRRPEGWTPAPTKLRVFKFERRAADK